MSALVTVSEAEVARLVTMADALEAVEKGLRAEAAGLGATAPKTVIGFDGGAKALHMLGAVLPAFGLCGVKTWVQAGAHAVPQLMLFNAESGELMAIIESTLLSNLRTGALAGIATDALAAKDAAVLGMIGSGQQAWTQVLAIAGRRKLTEIRVFSRDGARRQAFAEKATATLGIHARACASADEALEGAQIVGLAARVNRPVATSAMVAHGAHVNSVGITVAGRSELDAAILSRSALTCVDQMGSVQASSDELRAYYGTQGRWGEVRTLADVVAAGTHRPADADLTLYKGMGSGTADLALAAAILSRLARHSPLALPDSIKTAFPT